MGGAQAIGGCLQHFGPHGLDVRLAGLCDAGEEGHFRRGLERAGLGANLTRADMEALGFYVCERGPRGRAAFAPSVPPPLEQVIDAQGELGSFRTYQKQLAHHGRTHEEQVRGFMWNRKIRYAPLLVAALDLTRVPRPLEGLLAHV